MARTTLCSETVDAGSIPANVGGKHGGISPASSQLSAPAGNECFTANGMDVCSGNPGTETPWTGSDSTAIGANTALPPLKNLGTAGGGHEAA